MQQTYGGDSLNTAVYLAHTAHIEYVSALDNDAFSEVMLQRWRHGGGKTKNTEDYFAIERIFACGGTWMADKKMINEGRRGEIGRLAQEAADLVA
ncbi:hypothetical protein LRP52_27225 [Photobacterium sp. ZSDE20]|uniref:Carbohydrate kinase PfkB domain-containing protein n=1 Tax=Photobacterium pectinilyticum TaxID=2906793 RepID=A0ABT1N4N3_9GAMM|nr:hypothetical protein [Photobacterium sp. ZSDE20]MCQ1059706.1 hypothetical protein [Photobacterium sp. ZSDE20]MDD1825872.1 hypothetical protein [Photobacterium sp. ZSDE20]